MMKRLVAVIALITFFLTSCSLDDPDALLSYLNTSLTEAGEMEYTEVEEVLASTAAVTVLATAEENEDGEILVYVDHFGLYPLFSFTVSSATLTYDYDEYSGQTTYYVRMLSALDYEDLLLMAEAIDRAENTDMSALLEILQEEADESLVEAAATTASLYASVIDYVMDMAGYDLYDLEDEDETVRDILSYVTVLYEGLLGLSGKDSITKGDLLLVQLLDTTLVDIVSVAYDFLSSGELDLENLDELISLISDEILTDLGSLLNLSSILDGVEGIDSGIASSFNGIWDYCLDMVGDLL